MEESVKFLYETGMLSKTPRSGFAFLGSGEQSVAEHSFRMTLVAYTLARLAKTPLNLQNLLLMCLFHDLPEARTGDLNYVNKKYVQADEEKVLKEIASTYPNGPEIKALIDEYNAAQTPEAILAHDADSLELMLALREEQEVGNKNAQKWLEKCQERLKTIEGIALGRQILSTHPSSWWMINPDDLHWVRPVKN